MKQIELTQGQVAIVDDEDFARIGRLKWFAMKTRSTFYAARNILIEKKRTTELMHRVIMGATDRKKDVDHRDHDGLNNRRENLRVCSHAENTANRRGANRNSTTGIRGVFWDKSRGKYSSKILVRGRQIPLGRFDDKNDAAEAYAAANKKYFGEFGGNV